jgi:non-ribosomal peptide synthetase component F/aryl carrier-like protein
VKEVLTYRASHAQQQMWFIEQLVPDEPVHNISFERRYAGRLDPTTLRAAVTDLVGRHESLRTRLVVRDNTLWQVVHEPPDQPPVEFADLSGAADPAAAYRELCARVGTAVFDLGAAPLLRMVHARLGQDTDGLVVVLHHAIADAISIEIVIRDLTAAYEQRLAGRAPDWPELPVQYADFTAWQEERASDPAVRQDLDHWRAQLADLSTMDLTHGRPRPALLTQRGRRLDFTLEAGVVSALDEFVRTERATAFMGLLAIYAATLGRVFGSADVAVASPVAGRPLPELRDVIGMFVDQVVLRLDLSDGPTFRELVRAARRAVSDAHDHGSVTFDQIVTAVAPERVAGMTPLAQAAINLQPPVPARPPAGAMPRATDASQIDTGTVTHDLLLDLMPAPAPYTGTVRYRADVVDDAAAELVCQVFPRLLRAALAEPDRPMWTFQGLWQEPEPPADADSADSALVHELIERQADTTPHAPAVVWANGSLDFAGLDAAANRVAHALRARGAGQEDPVLVLVPNSVELAVAVFGVLKAGCVYVPVDPAAPAARIAAVIGRCGARLALTLAATVLPGAIETVVVAAVPNPDPGRPAVPVRPDGAACLMFGSGPDGAPRVVQLTHRNLASDVSGLRTVLPAGTSHLLARPHAAMTPLLCALAGGGALHVADETALGAFLATHPVDYLHTTPAHLATLDAAARPRRAVVLPDGPVEEARLSDAIVLYGQAETGIVGAGPHRVMAPMPGVHAVVLDRWGQSAPPGCLGELSIGGPQVARGYLDAPGATAAAFGPDPFAAVPGARRYRTGDLVRLLPDGRLEWCARPSDGEIPGVVEAAVREEPATPVEEALLDDWRWLLPKREFGVTDDFFDVGGDSILAIHAVAEARRHGLTLTVRQILDLRTIRALARAVDTQTPVHQPAPLGITGATVVRLPGPVSETPAIPGVTIDDRLLTADPSQVDDWSLSRLVRRLRPDSPADVDGVPGLLVPAETMAALAGPAHEAYATTTTDLVVAATLAATGAPAVAIADTRREEPAVTGNHAVPGLVRIGPADDAADLIRAVKSASHTPEEDDPTVPGVRVLSLPDNVSVTATGDAGARVLVTLAGARLIVTGDGGLAERVRDQVVRLVEHCVAAEPVYSAADFPDSGLDDAAVAGLLAGLEQDMDSEPAP